MILERLDGKDTAKLIEKPSFHDIHYVREMLFSVFCALDVSQKQLGFHHSDLRLANIMDIGPEPPNVGAGPSKARGQQPLTFPLSTAAPKGEGPGLSLTILRCCGILQNRSYNSAYQSVAARGVCYDPKLLCCDECSLL